MFVHENRVRLDSASLPGFVLEKELEDISSRVQSCHKMLCNGNGLGSDCLGWMDWPSSYDKAEFARIKLAADRIKKQSDVLLVVGIGGFYLGAKAGIEMLSHSFYNELPREKRKGPRIYFSGQNVSPTYINDLLGLIDGEDISINVISKSGTTTEPAIIFRLLKDYMEERYGKEEASKRIYVTTDREKGALKAQADEEGYESFVIPDDIGGRYSVLTPVGLLPMAVAGTDIEELMQGAQKALADLSVCDLEQNDAYRYAAIRNILYEKGKTTEIMVNYEPKMEFFGGWYKQLFGESEGKDGKGIFPTTLNFTTDLHSMGQHIQDGRKNIFETVLHVENSCSDIILSSHENDGYGLNYLAGKTLDFVNKKAMAGAMEAHVHGGVPNLIIHIPEISPYYFGYMVYFFQKACAMSGYLLGINPFDQPGVEEYKTNMFRLLGKPGY